MRPKSKKSRIAGQPAYPDVFEWIFPYINIYDFYKLLITQRIKREERCFYDIYYYSTKNMVKHT